MKRFFLISLVIIIFTIGCSKSVKDEEVNNDIKESEPVSTVEQLEIAYETGELSEKDYRSNKVSLLVNPSALEDTFSIQMDSSKNIDIAYDIQWMFYNYDQLSLEQKELLLKLIDMAQIDNKSSSNIPFIKTAHALGEDDTYPKKISENVYITGPLGIVNEDAAMFIENLYYETFNSYLGYLGIESLDIPIVISLYPMPPGIDSTSFYAVEETILPGDEPVFYIHINSSASDDTLKGSFLHEFFHVHQFQLGYRRIDKEEEFLMESTAIFAVAMEDKNLDYFNKFNEAIYSNPILSVDFMNQKEMKSWYQLYYMIYYELNDLDFVKDLLYKSWLPETLYEKLKNAAGSEDKLQNIFADFGERLFLDNPLISQAPYDNHTFYEEVYDDITSKELESNNNDIMNDFTLDEMGYYPMRVRLEDAEKAFIEIISNIGEVGDKTKTGLIVFYEKEGVWEELLDGKFESLVATLNLKKYPVDSLIFIPFSYDSEEPQEHSFAFNLQRRIEGEGFIDIHYEELSNPFLLTKEYEKEYSISIIENIELLEQSNEGEMADYMHLITGDSYYVKDFQALFVGDVTEGNPEEDYISVIYLGDYTYKDGDSSFVNNLLNFPTPDLGDLDLGLEGMFDGFADLPGVDLEDFPGIDLPEIPDVNQLIKDELGSEFDMESLLPPVDSLYRIKDDMLTNRFNLYPALPPSIYSDYWVKATKTHSYIDTDGKRKEDITIEDTLIIGEVFPLWFENPYFDPLAAENAMQGIPSDPNEFVNNYNDGEDILEQIAVINGKFDKSNLALAINEGPFNLDISKIKFGTTGTFVQELKYENKKFTAYIHADYITEDGSVIKVSIEFEYNFD